jgi:hypothetical protein
MEFIHWMFCLVRLDSSFLPWRFTSIITLFILSKHSLFPNNLSTQKRGAQLIQIFELFEILWNRGLSLLCLCNPIQSESMLTDCCTCNYCDWTHTSYWFLYILSHILVALENFIAAVRQNIYAHFMVRSKKPNPSTNIPSMKLARYWIEKRKKGSEFSLGRIVELSIETLRPAAKLNEKFFLHKNALLIFLYTSVHGMQNRFHQ